MLAHLNPRPRVIYRGNYTCQQLSNTIFERWYGINGDLGSVFKRWPIAAARALERDHDAPVGRHPSLTQLGKYSRERIHALLVVDD
jgi:hypothetical protein